MLRDLDIQSYAQLGRALWANPSDSLAPLNEALSGASMLDGNSAQLVEKAASALLFRAVRQGVSAYADGIQLPFYRLLPEERLVLTALHLGRWSYARLERVIQVINTNGRKYSAAQLAWQARMHLATQIPGLGFPTGSKTNGTSCPEYSADNPWTQRYLDEELAGQEKFFLQTHMQKCETCRKALNTTRQLYFTVEKWIPNFASENPTANQQLLANLKKNSNWIRKLSHPNDLTFVESLEVFFSRRESKIAVAVGTVLLFIAKMI